MSSDTTTRNHEETLILEMENLIRHQLYRTGLWYRFPNHREDFMQEGRLAIWKAIQTYDPDSNVKLSTYSYTLIRNAIYDYVYKMKLNKQHLVYPLFDDIVESRDTMNLDFLAMLELIEKDENSQILKDYFIYELSQNEVAVKNKMKQQAVSKIIVDFRRKARELFERGEDDEIHR